MVEGDPRAALRDVLTGLAEMSGPELANSRIGVALFTRDQEDEHSCFSDNTAREIYLDALGIQNVYLGRYERTHGSVVTGTGLTDLVSARDAALDARMRTQLEESVAAAEALGGPFDEMILSMDGRERLNRVTAALQAQVATLGEIALLFGIELALE
jgi:putative iron-regulated protein